MSRIEGQTALITGGASGIGLLLAEALLAQGLKTAILWDISERGLAGAAERLDAPGREIRTQIVDVSDRDSLVAAADGLDEAPDILVNNAGIIVGKAFVDHSYQDITRTMAINSEAPMHLTRAFLPRMIERGSGHIVNLASAAAMVSNPGMSVYCSSKWALTGWSDSLRIELERAETGVNVTTVMPFFIDTGMFDGVRSRIVPILKPDYVVRRMVSAIKRNKIFLKMPRFMNFVPAIRGLMPARWYDVVGGRWFGVYTSMDTFTGRQNVTTPGRD